jgi:hypothetical protein
MMANPFLVAIATATARKNVGKHIRDKLRSKKVRRQMKEKRGKVENQPM